MVNTVNFSNRIEKIIKFYDLSAAAFADKIEVGRSSISHILSGRNKPSLDFVMKVVQSFPEVELYWLLNGKGSFPPNNKSAVRENPNTALKHTKSSRIENAKPFPAAPNQEKNIKRIVIFYEDGSFESFQN